MGKLARTVLLALLASLLVGLAIGTALTRYARQVNRVYFVDLVGSALGGALSVFALQRLHAAEVIFVAGSAGVVAGFLFALQAGFGAALRSIPALVLALAVLGGATGGVPALGIPPLRWEVPLAPNKEIAKFGEQNLETRLPSATAEVQITAHIDGMSPFMGGDFGAVDWRAMALQLGLDQSVTPTPYTPPPLPGSLPGSTPPYVPESGGGESPGPRSSAACAASHTCRIKSAWVGKRAR